MFFKKGDTFTTTEFIKKLGCSERTWKRKKEEILTAFGKVIDFSIIKLGRKINYIILSDGEFEYERKKDISEERNKVFQDTIVEVVREQPLNTAANVSRVITRKQLPPTQFGYSDGTQYEYTRTNMKEIYDGELDFSKSAEEVKEKAAIRRRGHIEEKIWCRYDKENLKYIPMPEDEKKIWLEIMHSKFNKVEKQIEKREDVVADYMAGTITKEEKRARYAAIVDDEDEQAFISACQEFKEQYGYRPAKIPYYITYET